MSNPIKTLKNEKLVDLYFHRKTVIVKKTQKCKNTILKLKTTKKQLITIKLC
jgi:hypothetical protein